MAADAPTLPEGWTPACQLPPSYITHGDGLEPKLLTFSNGLQVRRAGIGSEFGPLGRAEFEQVSLTRNFDRHTLAAMAAVLGGQTSQALVELKHDAPPTDPRARGGEVLFWLTLGNSAFTTLRVDGASVETSTLSYSQIRWSQKAIDGRITERGWDLATWVEW